MSTTRKVNSKNPAPTEVEDDLEDFDQFWTERTRRGVRVKLHGEVIELPPSLPLQFELEARRMQRSKAEGDVRKLLTMLGFPDDAQTRWAEAGMDLEQFQVLLAWAPARIAGQRITLAEVAEKVAEANRKVEPENPT